MGIIGQLIYEWDQTLEEVNVYIKPPTGVTASILDCKITTSSVSVGLKGNPPYLNVCGSTHLHILDGIEGCEMVGSYGEFSCCMTYAASTLQAREAG